MGSSSLIPRSLCPGNETKDFHATLSCMSLTNIKEKVEGGVEVVARSSEHWHLKPETLGSTSNVHLLKSRNKGEVSVEGVTSSAIIPWFCFSCPV